MTRKHRTLLLGSLLSIACRGSGPQGPDAVPKQDPDGPDAEDAEDDEDFSKRRPLWWTHPNEHFPWPPPRPEGWPEDQPWPPLRELGADPGTWTEIYGDDMDPKEDARLGEPGTDGNAGFRELFRNRFSLQDRDRESPGCDLHRMSRRRTRGRESCAPYPEQQVRVLCGEVLDGDAALVQCRDHCLRNPRRCRRSRLIEPPVWTEWGCVTIPEEVDVGDDDPAFSMCEAQWICDCNER